MLIKKFTLNINISNGLYEKYRDLWIGLLLRKFVYSLISFMDKEYSNKLHDIKIPKPFSIEIIIAKNSLVWFSIYSIPVAKVSSIIEEALKTSIYGKNENYEIIFYESEVIDTIKYEDVIKSFINEGNIMLNFKSPTIMRKLLRIKGFKAYRKFPNMTYIIRNLAIHYNFYLKNKINSKTLFEIVEKSFHETIFNIRTIPIKIEQNSIINGLIGFCCYNIYNELLNKEDINIIAKLLAFGQMMGIGVGKTIGLGRIVISKR
jgi:CRISPR/Cas system endoribonuclease Cas6 (RAMP superfamily)